jgi:hypothetical protein
VAFVGVGVEVGTLLVGARLQRDLVQGPFAHDVAPLEGKAGLDRGVRWLLVAGVGPARISGDPSGLPFEARMRC